ncbi:gliding motility protein GldF [Ichthyobacterium seriolicida]|uniref:Gliding motility protein GldF n=1 Tax=Ichthyobacterium seriolicida TaxID=242600 RepID=A0A1J1DZW4_9FLAO|nr:gliding motility protein GldF [Ichthyobacterium seriolicida]
MGFEKIADYNVIGSLDFLLKRIGLQEHYLSMVKGVLDIQSLIYFFSITSLFILLTEFKLKATKW